MKIKTLLSAFSLAVSVSLHVNAQIEKLPMKEGIFEPDDSSLKEYGYPEWFRDAKFGIWSHWGPQAVPRQGDWYAKRMYVSNKYNWKEKKYIRSHMRKNLLSRYGENITKENFIPVHVNPENPKQYTLGSPRLSDMIGIIICCCLSLIFSIGECV